MWGAMRAVNSSMTAWRVRGSAGAAPGRVRLPEVQAPQLGVAGGPAHGADHRLVVQPVQRGTPGRLAGALEGGPGGGRVADADELGFRVPAERCQGVSSIAGNGRAHRAVPRGVRWRAIGVQARAGIEPAGGSSRPAAASSAATAGSGRLQPADGSYDVRSLGELRAATVAVGGPVDRVDEEPPGRSSLRRRRGTCQGCHRRSSRLPGPAWTPGGRARVAGGRSPARRGIARRLGGTVMA